MIPRGRKDDNRNVLELSVASGDREFTVLHINQGCLRMQQFGNRYKSDTWWKNNPRLVFCQSDTMEEN